MRGFRAYIFDQSGHISLRVDIEAADEATAKQRAKLLVDGHAVELWEGATKIARFEPVTRRDDVQTGSSLSLGAKRAAALS